MDSTKFTDWRKKLHELFISIRVKNKEALFPIHAKIKKFRSRICKGYLPIIKKGVTNPRVEQG
jgi:hypothetical protein